MCSFYGTVTPRSQQGACLILCTDSCRVGQVSNQEYWQLGNAVFETHHRGTCDIRRLPRVEADKLAHRGRCFAILGGMDGLGKVLYLDLYSRLLSVNLHSVSGEQHSCGAGFWTVWSCRGKGASTITMHCMFWMGCALLSAPEENCAVCRIVVNI